MDDRRLGYQSADVQYGQASFSQVDVQILLALSNGLG